MLSDLKKKNVQVKPKYFLTKIKLLTFSYKTMAFLIIQNNLIFDFDNKHTPAHDVNVFTHRFHGRLKLSVVQLLAVVKDVLICGVEACFHTVPNHIGRTRGRLQFQNLDTGGSREDKRMSECLNITM